MAMPFNFIPANTVSHLDGRGRQLEFSQGEDGTVEVKVTDTTRAINTVYQENIFVQPKSGLEQPEIRRVEDMTIEERKALLLGMEKKAFEVVIQDGAVSQIKKSNAPKPVFFRTVKSLTLNEK
jgi:hypothetical protein